MPLTRRIYPTRYGQVHLRSSDGRGVPLVLLHPSPRSGEMWEPLQQRMTRPTCAPDRLGYGFSDAPPWALSVEQYAHATLDALMAAEVAAPFDVLGVRTGSIEAVEIAAQVPERVRRVLLVGMPLFTPAEHARQMEKYSEQPLKPATEGGHVLGAWRGCFAFRSPPYDLADAHRRFVEHVLAANPGAALKAAAGYPLEKRLKSLRAPLTVLAPHDDIIEQTARIKPLLKRDDVYVDLPDLGIDLFHEATERMVELINRHAPA
jgi:pimeloyl-ACP methyl ester carboxylesterase